MKWKAYTAIIAAAIALAAAPAVAEISIGAMIPFSTDLVQEEILDFNTRIGKNNALVLFFRPMSYASSAPDPDDVYLLKECRKAGAVPLVGWETYDFSYGDIIAGTHDAYMRTTARAFRNFQSRILLSLDSEMNNNHRDPAQFKAMWRRIHDIFRAEGADNVEWVWSPNYAPLDYNDYYPGDEYVDWVGTEGFNWNDGLMPVDLFDAILNDYAYRYPDKPAIVLYMGVTHDSPNNKAAWITEAYSLLRQYGNLKAVIWWNDIAYDLGFAADFRVLKVSYPPGAAAVPLTVTDTYRKAVTPGFFLPTLPSHGDLIAAMPLPGEVLIDLVVSKSVLSTTDEITVTADVKPISTPFFPYIRVLMPNGDIKHSIKDVGFRGRVHAYLYGGPYVLDHSLSDYHVFTASFSGITPGTYTIEGYPLDESGRRVGPVDKETVVVQ